MKKTLLAICVGMALSGCKADNKIECSVDDTLTYIAYDVHGMRVEGNRLIGVSAGRYTIVHELQPRENCELRPMTPVDKKESRWGL